MLPTLVARRLDSIQEAPAPDVAPEERDRIYWNELHRFTLHTVRLHGRTLRALGVLPLMHFGPLDGDRRAIEGGLLVAEPGGTIGWEHEAGQMRVAVRGYAPRLPRPLYALQSAVHEALSRRYFRRLNRG
jgi:hypothetical protein